MSESVTPEVAVQEKDKPQEGFSDKARENFARLEAAKEAEREARIRAEMQAEAMRNELNEIKMMLQPKEADPLDGAEDYVDPARLKAKLEKERAYLKKEAKEIAKQTIREEREKEEKSNYLQRLKSQFPDYDRVMNEANIAALEAEDPSFLRAVLKVPDEYERRYETYERIKSFQSSKTPRSQEKPSIKEKVEENVRNPYHIQSSVATPSAVDFDLSSKTSRQQAYEKLKAAQRRPIGSGSAPMPR